MDQDTVRNALISTLKEVQSLMGQACPTIVGATVPINDLPLFDSKVWPVAFGMLGEKLKIDVPVDVNVFRREKTKIPNNIDETVIAILKAIQTVASSAMPTLPPSTTSAAALEKELA